MSRKVCGRSGIELVPGLLHLFLGDQCDRWASATGDATEQVADAFFEYVVHRLAELLAARIFLCAEVEEGLPVQLRTAEPAQHPGRSQRSVNVIAGSQQRPLGEGVPAVRQESLRAFSVKSFAVLGDG
jgi:hypothetical protein